MCKKNSIKLQGSRGNYNRRKYREDYKLQKSKYRRTIHVVVIENYGEFEKIMENSKGLQRI